MVGLERSKLLNIQIKSLEEDTVSVKEIIIIII